MTAITADAAADEEGTAPVLAPTAEEGQPAATTLPVAAVGPALTRGESASGIGMGKGMGAVRAAMVEGLYEAMRERLACQAEEVGWWCACVLGSMCGGAQSLTGVRPCV